MKNQRISRKWNTLRLKKGYVTIQIFTNAPAKEKKKAIGWNASLALKGTTFGACISMKAQQIALNVLDAESAALTRSLQSKMSVENTFLKT